MEVMVSEDLRSQVHTWLRALAERSRDTPSADQAGFHRLDVTFGRELAETERLDLGEVVVAVRLLRCYLRQLEALGATLPDEATSIDWAVEQDESISEEEQAIVLELSHLPEPQSISPITEQPETPPEANDAAGQSEKAPVAKQVYLQGGRIFVEFPFDRAKVNAIQPLKESVEDWAFNRYKHDEWSYPQIAALSVYEAIRGFEGFTYSQDAIDLLKRGYRKQALVAVAQEIELRWHELSQYAALEAAQPYLDGAPTANGQRLFRHQREAVQRMIEAERFILAHHMGLGKAQPLTAKILTPTSWKPMGKIAVGDEVINSQGGTSHVIGVFPQGEKDIYRVTFSDGSSTECCDEHLWAVNTPERKRQGAPPRVLPLKEIRQSLTWTLQPRENKGGNVLYRHFIPMVKPIGFHEQELPLHPYLLGVLLGDGGLNKLSGVDITSTDQELLDEVRQYLPEEVSLKQYSSSTWGVSIGNIGGGKGANPVIEALRSLNLQGRKSHDKFIPSRYLFASVASRVALLQGLLDTDGCVRRKDNNIEFSTSSPMLAIDLSDLIQSLGGRATVRNPCARSYSIDGERYEASDAYRMSIILPPDIPPFRLSRKALIYQPRSKYQPSRAIVAVDYVGRKEAQCIAVDSPDHLYVTDDYILTHNTKSSLIAAQAYALPIWVIAPAGTIINWQREAEAAGVEITLHSWAKLPEPPPDLDYVLITDEAHYAQSGEGSLRGQGFLNLAAQARAVFMLSGTPIKNALPINLWPLLVAAKHPLAADRSAYEKLYCGGHYRSIGRKRSVYDASGASNLDELHERTKDVILYKKKSECVDLPDKLRTPRAAEVSNAGELAYRKTIERLRQEHLERMADKYEALRIGRDDLLGEGMEESDLGEFESEFAFALVELGIYRHAASLAKVESAVEIAQEAIEQGQGVLLFTAFRDTAERLATKLDADCLTGEVSKTRKQAMIDRFQAEESKVLVATIGAGGIGINLTAAQIVVMVDRPWTPGDTEQAEDRAHRLGQIHNVLSIWLQYGPVDAKIDQLLELKQERIEMILRGRGKGERGMPGIRALAKEIMESVHTGKSLAEILDLDPAEFEQKAVDLVRDDVLPASRPAQPLGKRDGRLKGDVPRIRANVRLDPEVLTFLRSMKASNQQAAKEPGYSGFLEDLVRSTPQFAAWQARRRQS